MINIASTLWFLLAHGWRERESFQHFFQDVEVELSKAVTNNCSDVFRKYQHEHITLYGVYCVKTYSCIMTNVSEYTKANMASAAVLLGLTPTILTTLGSSTSELSLLSSHRPALALLLVLGSPAMNPIRTFDYQNPFVESQDKKWRWCFPKNSQDSQRSRIGDNIRIIVQLLFVIGSIANLTELCHTIALKTVSVMSCDFSDVMAELWIVLAIFAHLGGIVTFYMRYKTASPGPGAWLRYEFTLCVSHTSHGPILEKKENRAFIVWSFLTSVYTVVHLTAGTLIFSSLSFVGTWPSLFSRCPGITCFQTNPQTLTFVGNIDAVMIVARFMLSALICRIIVAYELAGLAAAEETRAKRQQKESEKSEDPASAGNSAHDMYGIDVSYRLWSSNGGMSGARSPC